MARAKGAVRTKDMGKKDCFDVLEGHGIRLTEEQRERIRRRVSSILSYEPRVGVFGKTGVGKSSLCNALFGQDICAISDVESCTRNPQEVLIRMGGRKGITLLDVPGVGESEARDEEYQALYESLLPQLDLLIWVLKADDRAFSVDVDFYQRVLKGHIEAGKPFFLVLNQADKVEPFREWDEANRIPGSSQAANLDRKAEVVSEAFDLPKSRVIPVSANERYNLEILVDEIVFSLPCEKKVGFVRSARKENVSSKAKSEAVRGFFQEVGESIGEMVGCRFGKVWSDVGKELGGAIGRKADELAKWLWDLF